jgi:hypothetical protein
MVSITSKPELWDRQPADMPRGLLPVPDCVKERVAEMARTAPVPPSEGYLQASLRRQTLEYHCGGQPVAYRESAAGVEVLAVGLKEIGDLVQRMHCQTEEDNRGIVFGQPLPWE